MSFPLTWVPRTSNRKTGDVPTAYVGSTLEECRESCTGCALLEGACYAWGGLARASFSGVAQRRLIKPWEYTLDYALRNRSPKARFARIGAMGDPARANREELFEAVAKIRESGLAVVSYTHFWREKGSHDLKEICLASCEDEEDAREALRLGWRPATLLPWWKRGNTFSVLSGAPGGSEGVVCPAQTKSKVTCNSCLMCDPSHGVWGKILAIGFLDHSRSALREQTRWGHGTQLPLFGEIPDVRPPSNPRGESE